jgi:hypothetical protein
MVVFRPKPSEFRAPARCGWGSGEGIPVCTARACRGRRPPSLTRRQQFRTGSIWGGRCAQAGYGGIVVPTLGMANYPKAIVDSVLLAVNNGARSAELVYKLMIAEMDVAAARWNVMMNAGLQTAGAMNAALLATVGVTPDAIGSTHSS